MNLNTLKHLIKNNELTIVLLILTTLSITSFFYFYSNNQLLLYGDSLSRMNISRKILDNLTPGLAQLGNVWLPLPQLLMMPFTANDFLWRSGIAGSIISMTSFVIGGIFLFKSVRVLTKSFLASLLTLSIYALNTNILLYQTTAMSEVIFICAISIALYYFILWIKFEENLHLLMLSGLAVSAATLIRYEALAILLASLPMVFFYTYYKEKNYHKAEGNTFLYATLAGFGFLLWTIYLALIFGDPLYWKNYYATAQTLETGEQAYTQGKSFFDATWTYLTAVVWMNGLIPVIFSVAGLVILVYKSVKQKTYYFLPILLTSSIFLFMILTLMRNTPIHQPALNFENILNPDTFKFPEFNIRYGMLMLPLITLLCSYIFSVKSNLVKLLLFAFLSVQFLTYVNPSAAIIFQLPRNVEGNITQGTPKEKAMVAWMQQNYNGDGLIMISALKHDPQMLQLGVDYKTYIHEGTDKYWKESTKNPQRYATWIIFDSWNNSDQVTKFLKGNPNLDLYFDRVYDKDGMWIYKIKTQPEKQI